MLLSMIVNYIMYIVICSYTRSNIGKIHVLACYISGQVCAGANKITSSAYLQEPTEESSSLAGEVMLLHDTSSSSS